MKQYTFLQEMNWAKLGVNAIGSVGQNAVRRGAVAGAGIGAVTNIARNAMKRDDDPTKKGIIRSAIGGAATGSVIGAAGGYGAKKLAQTSMAREFQNDLSKKAIDNAKQNGEHLFHGVTTKGNMQLFNNQKAANAWANTGSLSRKVASGISNTSNAIQQAPAKIKRGAKQTAKILKGNYDNGAVSQLA